MMEISYKNVIDTKTNCEIKNCLFPFSGIRREDAVVSRAPSIFFIKVHLLSWFSFMAVILHICDFLRCIPVAGSSSTRRQARRKEPVYVLRVC